ncbi:MAG: hypothetical protein ACYC5O_01430 [Anaerolineae bacterium]
MVACSRSSLEAELYAALHTSYEAGAKRGYRATRFEQMLEAHGAIETAKMLLADSRGQSGLYKPWDLNLLSDSLEAIVLQPRFRCLFTAEELAEARRRLAQLDYPVP